MRTEDTSTRFIDIDLWSTHDAVEAMLEGQLAAVAAVHPAITSLAAAADAAALRLANNGRIVYAGAGTSGRIAIQDGIELGPTYDWNSDHIVFALAGGLDAMMRSVENAEDNTEAAIFAMQQANLHYGDVVIGLAASGNTPFTAAALRQAKSVGALTIAIVCCDQSLMADIADHTVFLDTGSEPIAGSTRMKAGTAQKVALNILSTAIMIRLGRVYQGMMVNMRPTNNKLRTRGIAMVARITGCDLLLAEKYYGTCHGDVKTASLCALGATPNDAIKLLEVSGHNLRQALSAWHLKNHVLK